MERLKAWKRSCWEKMSHVGERKIRVAGRGNLRRENETKAGKFQKQGHMRPQKARLKKRKELKSGSDRQTDRARHSSGHKLETEGKLIVATKIKIEMIWSAKNNMKSF